MNMPPLCIEIRIVVDEHSFAGHMCILVNIHVPFGFEKTFSRETFLQLQILLQFSPSFWIDGLTSFVVARKKQARELRKRKRIPGGGVALRNSPNSLCDPSFWLSFAAQLTDHM